ncbi:GH23909 [Drosophila grimshawi]|uniref:GH23909 n=1 Tax=Drosophila grimshawi TaxID=7222 RepID=B4K1Z9_DROGR|nr:GH23909 [Drosophila grimshawi]
MENSQRLMENMKPKRLVEMPSERNVSIASQPASQPADTTLAKGPGPGRAG